MTNLLVATNAPSINVMMGEIKVGSAPQRLRTVLGSCIGVAIYDARNHVGGLAHIVLPTASDHNSVSNPGKYADTAIPMLIKEVEKIGGQKFRLVARIAGGANMFKVVSEKNIGLVNQVAVKKHLQEYGISMLWEDVGGEKGRRMSFDLETGKVTVEFPGDVGATVSSG